jgi:hypothetical protein
MKTIRIRLALWLAQREERAARNTRRALRNHIRREEIQALAIDRRALGLRLYAAWSGPRPECEMENVKLEMQRGDGTSLAGIRVALSNITLRRTA